LSGGPSASAPVPFTIRAMPWQWPVGAVCAFALAVITTPAGVSGATSSLLGLLVAGTLPGVVAGAIIRVELLSGSQAFLLVASGVLLPLGVWLMLGSQRHIRDRPTLDRRAQALILLLALIVRCAGGVADARRGSCPRTRRHRARDRAASQARSCRRVRAAGSRRYRSPRSRSGMWRRASRVRPRRRRTRRRARSARAATRHRCRRSRPLPEQSIRKLLGLIACLVAVRYLQEGLERAHQPRLAAVAR
jgi:uncharacterized protein